MKLKIYSKLKIWYECEIEKKNEKKNFKILETKKIKNKIKSSENFKFFIKNSDKMLLLFLIKKNSN